MEIIKKVIYIDTCKECGKRLRDDWKFCPNCKAPIVTFHCNYCGNELKQNWNFCPNCKKEISTEQKSKSQIDSCNEWLRDLLKKNNLN